MKYQVTVQSNDKKFEVEADDMQGAYDQVEKKMGMSPFDLDGNINDQSYSVAESEDDYFTIARID